MNNLFIEAFEDEAVFILRYDDSKYENLVIVTT